MATLRPVRDGAVLAAILGAATLAGCAGTPDGEAAASPSGTELRLVIPDMNIREAGAPCSGAGGYRFARPQAPYLIQDADGREIASGTLPEGTAEQAFTEDLGVDREPTVCVMMIEVPGLDSLDGHSMVVDDYLPVEIVPNRNLDDIPEVVLP